jgi:hypothetical protein
MTLASEHYSVQSAESIRFKGLKLKMPEIRGAQTLFLITAD